MKELSIKEKAHRYDEAIEVARKINSGDGVPTPPDWTTCEVIFPELRESEDEKMRKLAIKAVYAPEAQSCIKSWGINPDDVVAWIEKQGEQKPTWSEEDETKLRTAQTFISNSSLIEVEGIKEATIDWLKSLKDRMIWKPTEEQMEALKNMLHPDVYYYELLKSLYNDLKKL